MVRAMNAIYARFQISALVVMLPQFANAGQPARNKSQPVTRAPPRDIVHQFMARIGKHAPVDIIDRAIEVDHRARRPCHQQRRSGLPRHRFAQLVYQPIFQPRGRERRIAHLVKQPRRIGPPRMWHRYQHRNGRRAWRSQLIGKGPVKLRNLPAFDTLRIAVFGPELRHTPRLTGIRTGVKIKPRAPLRPNPDHCRIVARLLT